MKLIVKRMLFCMLLVLLTGITDAGAQRVALLFAHGIYASPLQNDFKNNYKAGFGAEAGGGIGWNKTFLIATIGYTSFGQTGTNTSGNISVIPVKGGLRHYLIGRLLYLHGDLGVALVKDKVYNESLFSGDLGVGVKLAGLELQADYDGFSQRNHGGFASWIGLKAGFSFGL